MRKCPLREAALAAGEPTYIGSICNRGHSLRYTSSRICVECQLLYRQANREQHREYSRERYLKMKAGVPTRMPSPREIARAAGLQTYHGKRCPRGHTERYVSNMSCVSCREFYRNSDPDATRAYMQEYYASHCEDVKERARNWYRDNKEKARRTRSLWHQNNLPSARAARARRRARIRDAAGSHTGQDLVDLFVVQKGLCAYCDADLRIVGQHTDHIVPLAHGGSNGPENLCLACVRCNSRKQALTGAEFRERLEAENVDSQARLAYP